VSWTPPTSANAPLTDWIRPVPDWPQPGVLFRDLTPLWADGRAWARAVGALARPFDAAPPDLVMGIEARGFLVAAALAARWGTGLVLARKPGKLPAAALKQDYELEYGRATLETHRDLIARGARILVADDVIATGGTAAASRAMVETLGCSVAGFAFLVEIEPLGGREALGDGAPVHSVVVYDGSGGATIHE
jgi:adenine phosphoribosyltransferase